MPKIGAHVSAAVSLETAFKKAQEIGAECMQIFISPPQQWFKTKHDEEEIERFKTARLQTDIGPNFIHGTYLINLGTQSPEHLQKSIDWLVWALQMAQKLQMQGVIFHTGSHKGVGFENIKKQVVDSLKQILAASTYQNDGMEGDRQPSLIIETSAGAGGNIGGTFHELGEILKQVQNERLKICIDLQHIFAAGYDVREMATLKDVLEEFDKEVGLPHLVAIHANDSKTEYKSGRDRHENIGEGFIGTVGFENLINHPQLANVPFLLEVPGFSNNGPDKENVESLKSLRK